MNSIVFLIFILQHNTFYFSLKCKLVNNRTEVSYQKKISSKRSRDGIMYNGRKKLKNSFCYDGEWYLDSGNSYHDFGEIIENEEVNYEVKYEVLQK